MSNPNYVFFLFLTTWLLKTVSLISTFSLFFTTAVVKKVTPISLVRFCSLPL